MRAAGVASSIPQRLRPRWRRFCQWLGFPKATMEWVRTRSSGTPQVFLRRAMRGLSVANWASVISLLW